jgi:NTE family protein
MIGIALEGGGAKGAYQAGAYIALKKNKIKPSIIAGTSIGSVNAALMAQGDIKKLVNLWLNTTTDIFGINSEIIDKIKHKTFTSKDIQPTYENIKQIIKNKGIDTTEYLKIIENNIDEKRLRKSKIKFGLITVKLDGKPTPLELTIDDIPEGKVAEYILASCYLPLFKFNPIIDNNYYIDGGFYNNIPLSLVEKYGCDTIYSIKIKGLGVSRNKLNKDTKIIEIKPKVNLGNIIIFDRETNKRNICLGYYDTLKVIKNLDGFQYYFKHQDFKYYAKIISKVNVDTLNKLKIKYHIFNSKDLTIKVIEQILIENNVNKFKILNIKRTIRYIRHHCKIKEKNLNEFINRLKI